MWVRDTDTLSLWLRGHPAVLQRVRAHEGDQLFVTIITIEEVLGGWYALIRQARDDEQLVRAYRWLQQSVEFFSATRILSLESTTLVRFRELRREHRRIGTNDLRIAAIVLEHDATLASRNLGDFGVIPGLRVEDWSRAAQ